ncbi:flagellin N-terminal helical domain-containing protein [Maledivibacter halophilus]|nr:flagellin [Maledivibacter halophilus]
MRINHNLMAMNTHRQLGAANSMGAKSMEKLSSGHRINRAGDDAAGLSISEKMRGQIRGLNQASRNSQDGISLIQTAEGALNETQAILQRMRELAVQSSNDTNVDVDRTAIQDEMNQLISEIDRISSTTEFNTQNLLDGTFNGQFQIGANEGQNMNLSISKMDSSNLGLIGGMEVETKTGINVAAFLDDGTYTINAAGDALLDAAGNEVGAVAGTDITLADGTTTVSFANEDMTAGDTIKISGDGTEMTLTKDIISGQTNKLSAGSYSISGTDVLKDGQKIGTFAGKVITFTDTSLGTLDAAAVFGKTADFADGNTFDIKGVDVSNRKMAEGSISAINSAIENVSAERSKLGAVQNRLEHTIKNLDTSSENLQASESRIRDVDMAKEMMEFTKNNILQQAAQAMLAQANQAPQGVLQLLR